MIGFRAQELCEGRGGRPGLPVSDSPCGHCGRKAILNLNMNHDGWWWRGLSFLLPHSLPVCDTIVAQAFWTWLRLLPTVLCPEV